MKIQNDTLPKYIAALEDSTRAGKGENQLRRLTLKPPSLRQWNFEFFGKLGAEYYGCRVYCNRLNKSAFNHPPYEKHNYLWDLCWFLEGENRTDLMLTLEQEFSDSPGNDNQWEAYFNDFTKITVATTQQCGVFIRKVPVRSIRKPKDVINEFNQYYEGYGHASQRTDLLVILITQKGGELAFRGWELKKDGTTELLPNSKKTFLYEGYV